MSEQTKDPTTIEGEDKAVHVPGAAVPISSADRRRNIIEAAEKRIVDLQAASLAAKPGDEKDGNPNKTTKRKKSYGLRGFYRQ
jgi:hypothetical protein